MLLKAIICDEGCHKQLCARLQKGESSHELCAGRKRKHCSNPLRRGEEYYEWAGAAIGRHAWKDSGRSNAATSDGKWEDCERRTQPRSGCVQDDRRGARGRVKPERPGEGWEPAKVRRVPQGTVCRGTTNGQRLPQEIVCEKAVKRRRLLQETV